MKVTKGAAKAILRPGQQDAKNFIRFSIAGDGHLIDDLGTSDGSRKIQLYNGRAIIKVKNNHGMSTVGVVSEGLKTTLLKLKE